jgi:hypothetical protein
MKPNTALIVAARKEAPKLNLYEANTRGEATVSRKLPKLRDVVFITNNDKGNSTIIPRYASVIPNVSPNPGKTLCCLKRVFIACFLVVAPEYRLNDYYRYGL